MKDETECADGCLSGGVGQEQFPPARRPTAGDERACHAAHEDRQHQRLRIRGMPKEQLEILAPDGLVDEAGESLSGEQRKQRSVKMRTRHAPFGFATALLAGSTQEQSTKEYRILRGPMDRWLVSGDSRRRAMAHLM